MHPHNDSSAQKGSTCPPQSIVGVARVVISVRGIFSGSVIPLVEPLFNLDPAVGEPARFGFDVEGTPVLLETALRTGGDYGVTVNVTNITQIAGFLGSIVTFWGVPGDPRHDNQRGGGCLNAAYQAANGVASGGNAPARKSGIRRRCWRCRRRVRVRCIRVWKATRGQNR